MNFVHYKKYTIVIFYIMVVFWLVIPCVMYSVSDTDIGLLLAQEPPDESQPRPSGATPPPIKRDEIYYDSEGLGDPFISLLVGTPLDEGKTPKPPGIKGMTIGELTTFGLGLWGDKPFAYVTGSDGKPYTLRVGDIVFDGRVKAITSDKLIFEKWVYDPLGRPKPPKTIEIKLHPTAEEVTR